MKKTIEEIRRERSEEYLKILESWVSRGPNYSIILTAYGPMPVKLGGVEPQLAAPDYWPVLNAGLLI